MPAIHDLYMLRQSSRAMQTSITEITARLAKVTELVLALRAAPVRGYGGGTGDDDALFTAIGPIGGGATALSCSAIFSVVVCIRGGGSDVTPHSSPVSLGTINSTVAMEDYRVASSPFPSTTTAAARDLTTASFSGGCDYAERCSTTRSIACGANGVGSRQAMRAGKEGTAAAAQREQHARQSPGAPPPTRAAVAHTPLIRHRSSPSSPLLPAPPFSFLPSSSLPGWKPENGLCSFLLLTYPPALSHLTINESRRALPVPDLEIPRAFPLLDPLEPCSDEAMDRTNPRGLHLGVMSSGRMLIDVNPPTLLLVVMKGKQMKVLDLKFRLTINVVLQTLAARRHCAQSNLITEELQLQAYKNT
ncbi:hypothetical protein OsI_02995 [Oryza sativa Indica Group]|uniref:Uncharacterized protein n=1 Tax=Oryza sativa subsp. indica TaxID=39946 RepID=A2WT05_ORYSI|nr:hypothetical protein OsI_02995 [Oryza sativa Indica Group]